MPQKTNLNTYPYFDDFNPDNIYHKILFKPGYPIQARELTTLQSILQNQIEQFGNWAFQEGSPVVPGSITYNANLLVTYKVIKGYSDPEYATDKVASIEWDLHNARQTQKSNAILHDKIDSVKNIITESFADSDDQETLRDIAEALGIELTKTVEWTATIEVSGTIELDILQEYDVESELYDNLYVDSQNGQIEIVDTEVTSAREC